LCRPFLSDQLNNFLVMLREHPHTSVTQGGEDGVADDLLAKLCPHFRMEQDIDGRNQPEVRKADAAKARRLVLVDNGRSVILQSIGDRGCLAVIEGFNCGAGDETLKVPLACVIKSDDVEMPCGHQLLKPIGILSSTRPSCIQLAGNDIDHDDPVWNGLKDRGCTASRKEINDGAGVSDQRQG
jgi:hypothetical protein